MKNHVTTTTSSTAQDGMMFFGIKSCNSNSCEHCILGKQKSVRLIAYTSESCVFLGYGYTMKGNRLWDPTTHKREFENAKKVEESHERGHGCTSQE